MCKTVARSALPFFFSSSSFFFLAWHTCHCNTQATPPSVVLTVDYTDTAFDVPHTALNSNHQVYLVFFTNVHSNNKQQTSCQP